ncbi:hypothetical protein CWI36_0069p0010 [Hamiltosporidium magnivora]|uniref:Uncharacterized protein n=1 Tax=Hamiltosporidium magnivora TaxID=148818 RepID=A0A4Q9LLR2_9MICR|nr:hypothetical protein CWI36_0069p0010 [Hamiltosporidium magnivora]
MIQKKIFSEIIIFVNLLEVEKPAFNDFISYVSNEESNRYGCASDFNKRKRKSVFLKGLCKETRKIVRKRISVHQLNPLNLKTNEFGTEVKQEIQIYLPHITASDFDLFCKMLQFYCDPLDYLPLETFFKFLNILSCLNLVLDKNLDKILLNLLISVRFPLENDIYELKPTILQYIETYTISSDIVTTLGKLFKNLSLFKIGFELILFLNTTNEKMYHYYNVKFETKSAILISKNLKKIFSNQNFKNTLIFKVIFIVFLKMNFKTAIFHTIPSKNTELRHFLSQILDSVDKVIFYKLSIDKKLISFLNKENCFNNLTTVYFFLPELQSNILSFINYLLNIPEIFIEFDECFEESEYKKTNMNYQVVIKVVRYRLKRLFILENFEFLDIKNYILNSVFEIKSINDFEEQFRFLNKIVELHNVRVFLYGIIPLATINIIETYIWCTSINLILDFKNEIYSLQIIPFANVKTLKIRNTVINTGFIGCILNIPALENLYLFDYSITEYNETVSYPKNDSITSLNLYGKEMIGIGFIYKFLSSMINLENLALFNDNLSVLLDSDQKCKFSPKIQLKVLEFCCIFKNSKCDCFFYFPFFVNHEISFEQGFPPGTLKKIFSIPENTNIKKLSYLDNYLDYSDIGALENLKLLENIEWTGNNSKIRFYMLFNITKTYNIKFLDLNEVELVRKDIKFICSLKSLEILNLTMCSFKKKCYRMIRRNKLKTLKCFYFENFFSTKNKKIKMHLQEEFPSSILSISLDN